jgi:hypothetical protein
MKQPTSKGPPAGLPRLGAYLCPCTIADDVDAASPGSPSAPRGGLGQLPCNCCRRRSAVDSQSLVHPTDHEAATTL